MVLVCHDHHSPIPQPTVRRRDALVPEQKWSRSEQGGRDPSPVPQAAYDLCMSRPRMVMRLEISSFPNTVFMPTSRTFNSFPRNGNTPNRSRPTTDRPATASAFAESPSVRMSVH